MAEDEIGDDGEDGGGGDEGEEAMCSDVGVTTVNHRKAASKPVDMLQAAAAGAMRSSGTQKECLAAEGRRKNALSASELSAEAAVGGDLQGLGPSRSASARCCI